MKEEFLIERQGKKYALYAGLLDEAHEKGLSGIDTELLQAPEEANGNVAIVKAVARIGDDTYSGIGDASPDNVGRTIAPHLIRMSETRAKARALRDAINVGAEVMEDGFDETASNGGAARNVSGNAPGNGSGNDSGGQRQSGQRQSKMTDKQRNYLISLIDEDMGREAFEKQAGKSMDDLSTSEASDWIKELSGNKAGAS